MSSPVFHFESNGPPISSLDVRSAGHSDCPSMPLQQLSDFSVEDLDSVDDILVYRCKIIFVKEKPMVEIRVSHSCILDGLCQSRITSCFGEFVGEVHHRAVLGKRHAVLQKAKRIHVA